MFRWALPRSIWHMTNVNEYGQQNVNGGHSIFKYTQ